jgi:hypothetical protein
MNRRGITTLELLIVLAIIGIVGVALLSFLQSGNQVSRLQDDLTALEQSAAIAAEIVQKELGLAGYRSNPDVGLGQMTGFIRPEADKDKARSLSWLASAEHWKRFVPAPAMLTRPSGCSGSDPQNRIETVVLFTNCGSYGGDEVWLRLVEKVEGNAYPNLVVRHREARFRLDGSNREFERRSQDFVTPPFSLDTPPNLINLSQTTNPSWQPLTNFIEDFQVFFLSNSGWTTSRPGLGQSRAIGVYLRMRADNPVGPAKCSWPQITFPDGQTAAALGIPSKTYTGSACKYRRLERVLTVKPGSPQYWE